MLIEILNSASDVYSNLYSFRTLAALYRADPTLANPYGDILPSLLLRVLNQGSQGTEGSQLGSI